MLKIYADIYIMIDILLKDKRAKDINYKLCIVLIGLTYRDVIGGYSKKNLSKKGNFRPAKTFERGVI